jgi:uncharacterized surface protein with fasciclin (FAS1) repeats
MNAAISKLRNAQMKSSIGLLGRIFVALALAIAISLVARSVATAAAAAAAADDKKQPEHKHDHDDHAGHDHGGSLVDILRKHGEFNTLAAAIAQAELEEDLAHDDHTIFAPTDAAFAKLPPEKLDDLLKPENKEKLKAVLLNHVVEGKLRSADVTAARPKELESAGGAKLVVKKSGDGKVTVNNAAKVVAPDVEATNGWIHGIDTVLIPAAK